MKSFSTFVTLLLFLLIIAGATANLQELCKQATSSSPIVTYDFCIKSLQPIRGSNEVDAKGLVGITINLSLDNLVSIINMLSDLQSKTTNQTVLDALNACSDGINKGTTELKVTQYLVSHGYIQESLTSVRVAEKSSDVCDSAFNQRGIQSPVHDAMHDPVLLCNLVDLIIQLLV
ncbi:Plant invertase/pectin methylesterase inhibitor protein [Dioscorea alata]|uniref:Plant invertase/pectin methylesterase inhibitor protein n=1 Tax=Dioscorea alata TaxID=55571 RepID=A0ACB7U4S3_DIOAL|nr:Plant invertase/pectin methylesterase inhibitor protein [Dioscorea alata]